MGISIKNLLLQYEDTVVIDHLSENIGDGQIYALFGASGSGKTSLLKILAGLITPDGGSVEVNGKNIFEFSPAQMLRYHKHSGFVFQNSALVGSMSIFENLALYYEYHSEMGRQEIVDKIGRYIDYVGFSDNLANRPATLSTGEKMLINIVRAIMHDPEFTFWDEPFANLDAIYGKRVKNIILDQKKEKKTMVIVTHDFDFAFSVADRVGILHQGRIVESGTPDEIKRSELDITKSLLS